MGRLKFSESSSSVSILLNESIFKLFLSSHNLLYAIRSNQTTLSPLLSEISSASIQFHHLQGILSTKHYNMSTTQPNSLLLFAKVTFSPLSNNVHHFLMRSHQNGLYCPYFYEHYAYDLDILEEDVSFLYSYPFSVVVLNPH